MDRALLDRWLAGATSGNGTADYSHLHLTQAQAEAWRPLLGDLIKYFEWAHSDARRVFREEAALSLDPVAPTEIDYPRSMPDRSKRGFFGEVMCGISATCYQVVSGRKWHVPIFLFRNHESSRQYLTHLLNGDPVGAQTFGRTGSDFIAVALDPSHGGVIALLAAEAKCHATFALGEARGALENLSREVSSPVSLGPLRKILEEIDPENSRAITDSIFAIQTGTNPHPPRVDLLLYAFDAPGVVNYTSPRVSPKLVAGSYSGGRPLQVIEIHVDDLATLVSTLYGQLFTLQEEADAAK